LQDEWKARWAAHECNPRDWAGRAEASGVTNPPSPTACTETLADVTATQLTEVY
jgi:hypothetical protein